MDAVLNHLGCIYKTKAFFFFTRKHREKLNKSYIFKSRVRLNDVPEGSFRIP